MAERSYIRVSKPLTALAELDSIRYLRDLDTAVWKEWVLYHLLVAYRDCDRAQIKSIIQNGQIEDSIAKCIRKFLKDNKEFSLNGFLAKGGILNDEDVKGIYDISILHSFLRKDGEEVAFHFECKNLNSKQDLINKYVYYDMGHKKFDGGVYRYFNGKYAQSQDFGGMIGFILYGKQDAIQTKIKTKLEDKFNTSPDGDLLYIQNDTLAANKFCFESIHKRCNTKFTIHHLLFDFT